MHTAAQPLHSHFRALAHPVNSRPLTPLPPCLALMHPFPTPSHPHFVQSSQHGLLKQWDRCRADSQNSCWFEMMQHRLMRLFFSTNGGNDKTVNKDTYLDAQVRDMESMKAFDSSNLSEDAAPVQSNAAALQPDLDEVPSNPFSLHVPAVRCSLCFDDDI